MIYGKLVQSSVPSIQSEKDAMLETLESELNYYNNLFLNESGYVDESTRMVLEAKREVLQEAVGAALIAAIIAAITALIALIIKGTKAVTQKAVEVVKNTSNKNEHMEKLKKYKEKAESKAKESSSSSNTNTSNSSTSKKKEENPEPAQDLDDEPKETTSRSTSSSRTYRVNDYRGSGKRIEQKPEVVKKENKDIEKAKIYYNKFISKISSATYEEMHYWIADMTESIYKYFNINLDDKVRSPFFVLEKYKFSDLKDMIGELTEVAKEALSGDTKSKKSNKEYFDELMDNFSPKGVLNNIATAKAEYPDDMDKSLEHFSIYLRSRNSNCLPDIFGSFRSNLDGNDINRTLEQYLKSQQKNLNDLKSLESPLKNLKSIFEQFKNKYKVELSDKLDKAEEKEKIELQNYLLKVNATGIENISKLIKFYYKCTLSDMANYKKLADYTRTELPKLYLKSEIKSALDDDPNLDKIPEFHSLKQQYLDDED